MPLYYYTKLNCLSISPNLKSVIYFIGQAIKTIIDYFIKGYEFFNTLVMY